MKKKSYLSLIWKRWKREMTARLPVTVSSVQTWFYMYAYVKKSSPGSTQLPTSRHLLSPPTCATMTLTHTHIHTPINRLWSPLAYGQGGNKYSFLHSLAGFTAGSRSRPPASTGIPAVHPNSECRKVVLPCTTNGSEYCSCYCSCSCSCC